MAVASARAQEREIYLRLERDTVIGGVSCAATGRARASLFPSGRLRGCPVAKDTTISGNRFTARTWVYLTESGDLRSSWLNQNERIQGVLCRGSGYKTWITEYHPGGRLRLCFLYGDAIIDGVPCRGSSFLAELGGSTHALFHENGRLRGCVTSRSYSRNGIAFSKHRRIELDSAGTRVR